MIRFHVSYRSGNNIRIKNDGPPDGYYTRFYGIDSTQDNSKIKFLYPVNGQMKKSIIGVGYSTSNYVQLNGYGESFKYIWETYGWTTNNLSTFASEVATDIVTNHAAYVGDKTNINLYIFSGKPINVLYSSEDVWDNIVVLIYEGNDTNADEIIEV